MVQLGVMDSALQVDGSCRREVRDVLGRTGAFRELSGRRVASLHFPICQVPYEVLMADLEASGIVCEVSAVTEAALDALAPGQTFDRHAMSRLPNGVDRFVKAGCARPPFARGTD